MFWLVDEGYICYVFIIWQEGIDQVVLMVKGMIKLYIIVDLLISGMLNEFVLEFESCK